MGRTRFGGRLVAALAVLAVAAVVAPARAVGCPAHQVLPDGWTRISAPSFPAGIDTLTGYDVAEFSARDLVVTNGRAIATSGDGGCTWNATVPADGALGDDVTVGESLRVVGNAITQVRFSYGFAPALWAIGQTEILSSGVPATAPRVLVSADRGRTFTPVVEGLPAFARPVAIRGLGADSAVLLVRRPAPESDFAVYTLSPAQPTWQLRWSGLRDLRDFSVDWAGPRSPRGPMVWLWGSGGLHRARVTDEEVRRVEQVNGAVSTVDLLSNALRPTTVFVYHAGAAERSVSYDGGETFKGMPAPEDVLSATSFQPIPGIRALSSLAVNVLIESPFTPSGVDFSPQQANVSDLKFVVARPTEGMPLYAFEPTALYRRDVPLNLVPPRLPPPPLPPVDVEVRDRKVVPPTPSIEPRNAVIRLRPGQRRTVDFQVKLPPVPTPLDVFFMTDSTGSMGSTIGGVQRGVQDVVDGLAATGISVQFGVADFRDYSSRVGDANYPYKRRRAIGPIDDDLAEALESITTGGGTPDGHDAGLEAIYQAATGAGRTDPLLVRGELIPPGLGAQFRPEAMKVILVATDDNFRHPETNPGYPGPSVDTVSAALRERGVYLVGLHVETGNGSAKPDMETLARDTGAVAPANGVDCDDDGASDLDPGDPLVCDFAPANTDALPDMFVSMLAGIEDYADVDLTVRGAGPFVRVKGELHHPDVNVKAPNAFTLPVEFRCGRANAGTSTPVRVSASSRGEEHVATNATLECVAPVPPPEPPRVAPPPAVAAALVPPPPPPPAPVANANPNVNPNVNPNPNPQVNANSGFAAQEDQEFQLALANNQGVLPDDELAMSGLDRVVPPVPALAWAAVVAMTGAAAFGMRLSRRVRTSLADDLLEHR